MASDARRVRLSELVGGVRGQSSSTMVINHWSSNHFLSLAADGLQQVL